MPGPVRAFIRTVSLPDPPMIVRVPTNAGSRALTVTLFVPVPSFSVTPATVSTAVIEWVSPPALKSTENVLSVVVPLSARTTVAAFGDRS